MRKYTSFLFAAALACSASLFAQNDAACDAIDLPTDGTTGIYDNTGYGLETGEDAIAPPVGTDGANSCVSTNGWCGGNTGIENSAWFTFTAPASGAVEINTCSGGNAIDTQLAVYEVGDCADFGTYTFLGGNDDLPDGCAEGTSTFASNLPVSGLTEGTTYYILVDSYLGEQGAYEISVTAFVPPALVQVIHNSPDDAATTVDIWLDDTRILDDFAFRTATNFLEVPSDVDLTIGVAPADSESESESVYTLPVNLESGVNYILVANGITGLSGTSYDPAPAFGIDVFDMGRTSAADPANTDVLVHHGSTDAPTVDVFESQVLGVTAVDNAPYQGFVPYLELPTADYVFVVQDEMGMTDLFTYAAPLAALGLNGAAITVVASGFVVPENNGDGPEFGLWVATAAGGPLLPLAAPLDNDNPCGAIDLPVDGTSAIYTNVGATTLPGEDAISPGADDEGGIGTAGWFAGDTLTQNSVWFTFTAPESGAVNISTCYAGTGNLDTQVAVYSATDCNDLGTLTEISANDDGPDGCAEANNLATDLDICGLTPGQTYWLVVDGYAGASGEFEIGITENDPCLARLQVIHNSADDAAPEVDIYLNGGLFMDDFAFRTAEGFFDAPAEVEILIQVAPGNSTSADDAIADFPLTLAQDETYIAVAAGITGLSGTEYNPAPAFNLEIFAGAREAAAVAGNTDVLVFHGATDAPTVDVAETGVGAGIIVDDMSYPEFASQGYLELGTLNYELAVQTADNQVTVGTYDAPLADLGLEDVAITVLASGFLSPEDDGDGAPFGLWVALPAGGDLIPLDLLSSVNDFEAIEFSMRPNPATDVLFIDSVENIESLAIYDMQGRVVLNQAGNFQTVDVSGLADGLYQVAVSIGERTSFQKLIVQ